MPANQEQADWVRRVLGFDIADPAAGAEAAVDTSDKLAIWREAKEQVDSKLSALANALKSYDDPDLNRIAEFGLFGATSNGENVALNKALREYGSAAAERREAAAKQVRGAVAAYRSALNDPTFKLIDDNPFGIVVDVIPTLGGALDLIEKTLA